MEKLREHSNEGVPPKDILENETPLKSSFYKNLVNDISNHYVPVLIKEMTVGTWCQTPAGKPRELVECIIVH